MSWEPAVLDLGEIRLTVLDGGSFRLDGATLYGVLPRVFWERMNHPDEDNRVLLATAPMVVETEEGVAIIDPGLGDGWGEAAADRYDLEGQRALNTLLGEAGIDPADVVAVIATHLHFDHVSAAVTTPYQAGAEEAAPRVWGHEATSEVEPALPGARLYVQRLEWEAARQPELRTVSFVAPAVCSAWERAGKLELVEGDAEILPGIRVEFTGGHTPGHQVVWIEGEGGSALLAGDLLPTTTHLRSEVVEGVDYEPHASAGAKAELLAHALEHRAHIAFYHAPRVRWGRLQAGSSARYELIETHTVPAGLQRRRKRD